MGGAAEPGGEVTRRVADGARLQALSSRRASGGSGPLCGSDPAALAPFDPVAVRAVVALLSDATVLEVANEGLASGRRLSIARELALIG